MQVGNDTLDLEAALSNDKVPLKFEHLNSLKITLNLATFEKRWILSSIELSK